MKTTPHSSTGRNTTPKLSTKKALTAHSPLVKKIKKKRKFVSQDERTISTHSNATTSDFSQSSNSTSQFTSSKTSQSSPNFTFSSSNDFASNSAGADGFSHLKIKRRRFRQQVDATKTINRLLNGMTDDTIRKFDSIFEGVDFIGLKNQQTQSQTHGTPFETEFTSTDQSQTADSATMGSSSTKMNRKMRRATARRKFKKIRNNFSEGWNNEGVAVGSGIGSLAAIFASLTASAAGAYSNINLLSSLLLLDDLGKDDDLAEQQQLAILEDAEDPGT